MSRTVKWILGILIGLVVLAAIAAIGYFVFNSWAGGGYMMGARVGRAWQQLPRQQMPYRNMPMYPGGGMGGSRIGIFGLLGRLAGGLLCLGILGALVLGVYLLVRSMRRPSGTPMPVASAPVAPITPAPAVEPVAVIANAPAPGTSAPVEPSHTCANCQRPVQVDWVHCPYCGAALT